ncbi:MAG: helix-turn-helix domain-containing protein [Pseudolabrys sp.]
MKRVAAHAQAALPCAPSKLQQLDAQVRAGLVENPFRSEAASGSPDTVPSWPDLFRPSRLGTQCLPERDPRDKPAGDQEMRMSLTARVRALYEDGLVPVRELARLVGVTERTLYKYAARGRWRKRYARRALTKGAGGRFVAREEREQGAAQASGIKALDPPGAAAAEAACEKAVSMAERAARAVLAGHAAREAREAVLHEFETRVRRLALLTRTLKLLDARMP